MCYLSTYGNLDMTRQLKSLQRVGCDYWTQSQDALSSVWLLTAGGLWPLTLEESLEHLWCLWCLWCLECLAGRRVWAWEQNKRSGGSAVGLYETRGFFLPTILWGNPLSQTPSCIMRTWHSCDLQTEGFLWSYLVWNTFILFSFSASSACTYLDCTTSYWLLHFCFYNMG